MINQRERTAAEVRTKEKERKGKNEGSFSHTRYPQTLSRQEKRTDKGKKTNPTTSSSSPLSKAG